MENRRSQWSDLRAELLELILEKLDLVDHSRFASVCSSWRSVAINNPPINKPLFMALSHDPTHLVRRFISSFIPNSWREATFIGAAVDGWLVALIDGKKLFLLNKGFNKMIPVSPPAKHPKKFFKTPVFCKAVLSSPPRLSSSSSSSSSYECTVVIKHFKSGVFYCRLGSDESFTKLSSIPPWPEDILFYEGRLYVLCCRKIIIIKFNHLLNKVVSQSQLVTHLADSPTPRRFLISGNNNILSIVAGLPSGYSVFTLEGGKPRLVRVNNIGEDDNFQFQTLLSNYYCSLSITTKEHKEFRRPTNYFNNDFSTLVLETSKDPNKAKAGDPWPLFFVMFSYHGIENLVILDDGAW